jgi:hypothetical protein
MTALAGGMIGAFGRVMVTYHTPSRHLGHVGVTTMVEGYRKVTILQVVQQHHIGHLVTR